MKSDDNPKKKSIHWNSEVHWNLRSPRLARFADIGTDDIHIEESRRTHRGPSLRSWQRRSKRNRLRSQLKAHAANTVSFFVNVAFTFFKKSKQHQTTQTNPLKKLSTKPSTTPQKSYKSNTVNKAGLRRPGGPPAGRTSCIRPCTEKCQLKKENDAEW